MKLTLTLCTGILHRACSLADIEKSFALTMHRFILPLVLISAFISTVAHAQNARDLPLQPAVGKKDILWIRAEFGEGKLPDNSEAQINATMNTYRDYLKRVSGGKAEVGEVRISPVYKSKLTATELKNDIGRIQYEMNKLARADKLKLPPFVYYMFDGGHSAERAPLIDIGAGALGSGDGKSGSAWVPNIYVPGVVHESFHMLGVGHAEGIIGEGKSIYPGKNVGGLDPYFFMGSEEDMTHSPAGNTDDLVWSLDATIPLSMKSYMGWLSKKNLLRSHGKATISQRIYQHDGARTPPDRLLGIVLEGYSKTSRFMISYVKNAKSRAIKTTGVLVHELPYESPAVSRLLDLHPDSVAGNSFRPGSETYDHVFELGDAAITKGEDVAIPNFFTIKVVAEGGEGDERWADVVIAPTRKSK